MYKCIAGSVFIYVNDVGSDNSGSIFFRRSFQHVIVGQVLLVRRDLSHHEHQASDEQQDYHEQSDDQAQQSGRVIQGGG